MGESINCNYARAAIRYYISKHSPSGCCLPKGSMTKVLADYNRHFAKYPNLKEKYSRALKKFPAICSLFNHRWHPNTACDEYLATFSLTAWGKLSSAEKQQHTLENCQACQTQFPGLSAAFLCKQVKKKKPLIHFSEAELSTPNRFA